MGDLVERINAGLRKLDKEEAAERSPVERPGYVNICARCKFLQYEDRTTHCAQGHWSGDDDPENPPTSIVDDPWADCEDFET